MARVYSMPLKAPRTHADRLRLAGRHTTAALANLIAARQQYDLTPVTSWRITALFWLADFALRLLDTQLFARFWPLNLCAVNDDERDERDEDGRA